MSSASCVRENCESLLTTLFCVSCFSCVVTAPKVRRRVPAHWLVRAEIACKNSDYIPCKCGTREKWGEILESLLEDNRRYKEVLTLRNTSYWNQNLQNEWVVGGRGIDYLLYKIMHHFIKSQTFPFGSRLSWCTKNMVESIIKLIIHLLANKPIVYNKHSHAMRCYHILFINTLPFLEEIAKGNVFFAVQFDLCAYCEQWRFFQLYLKGKIHFLRQ